MNDPHVEALIYRVRHRESVDYGKAEPLTLECERFSVHVCNKQARFELKEHFATEQEARQVVEPFIRNWEFDSGLRRGPDWFVLEFDVANMIDRKPKPGVTTGNASPAVFLLSPASAKGRVSPSTYYSPPEGDLKVDHPDVQTLYQRYQGYKAERERLGSFANFCLTVLENSVGRTNSRRAEAAKKYGVAKAVLNRIGELCDTKGGDEARKAKGVAKPFSAAEKQFLESAVKRLIYRVAEHHGSDGASLPSITMAEVEAGSD